MKITEEQKQQLLNLNDSRVNDILGVTTLKDNTWYIYNNGGLQFNIKDGIGYGITCENEWIDEVYWIRRDDNGNFREAKHEEVENALIDEAKRRGLTYENKLKDCNDVLFDEGYGYYVFENNKLYYNGATLFYNGKWAEVIEKPNKQEIINQINELLKKL